MMCPQVITDFHAIYLIAPAVSKHAGDMDTVDHLDQPFAQGGM
jgi:hypothetical protein